MGRLVNRGCECDGRQYGAMLRGAVAVEFDFYFFGRSRIAWIGFKELPYGVVESGRHAQFVVFPFLERRASSEFSNRRRREKQGGHKRIFQELVQTIAGYGAPESRSKTNHEMPGRDGRPCQPASVKTLVALYEGVPGERWAKGGRRRGTSEEREVAVWSCACCGKRKAAEDGRSP